MSKSTPIRSWWSSPDVHFARVEEDIVILDVRRDQYLCLPDVGARLVLGADGRIGSTEPDLLQMLAAAGLLIHAKPARARPVIKPAARELTACPDPARGLVAHAVLSLLSSAIRYRGLTLSRLVAPVPYPSRRDDDPHRLALLVGAARRARVWIPFEGECLKRTFQLRALLARNGVAADWIFGVRTWPFGAHCWLQCGDLVVGDRLERVSRYTPIMKA